MRASVRFLGPDTDAYVSSVQRHAAEFEEQTGIELEIEIVPSDLYFSNKIHHLLEGERAGDVYMSGPVLVWEHHAKGFVQPLDEFLNRASDGYEPQDFVDRLLHVNRWSGVFGEPLGDGPLLEIPVNCESYNLAYLPSVLEEAGIDVPETWPAYFAAARAIVAGTGGRVRGFGQRGTDAWHTMYTGFATQLWSYGGSDFEDGRCAIASSASVRATSDFLAALHDAGPRDWPEQRWYELALDFARGQYGLLVDSDHYVAYFEDPTYSERVGQIMYTLPPIGDAGAELPKSDAPGVADMDHGLSSMSTTPGRRANLWTWSLVMNSRAKDRYAAWRFIEWASSKDFLRRSAYEGNMNPTRSSIWNDERFREHTSSWGDFYDVARTLVERDASVLVTPAGNYLEIARRWVQALLEAYAGRVEVAEALQAAASDIDELVAAGASAKTGAASM